MKSYALGKSTSAAEVQNITKYGIWLYAKDREYFLSYKEYPWFEKAKISDVYNLKLLHEAHLHWPALDVDLEIKSLENPEKYALLYR